jgi:GT2 family glycosyltransferase
MAGARHARAVSPAQCLGAVSRRLRVVIVNYRTADLAVGCLRSIADTLELQDRPGVTVVDNASGDGSAAALHAAIDAHGWGAWASVLAAERNGGFAYGNNAGIRAALASPETEYLLLLNPDTVVRPGAVDALVAFMDAHPRAGIAGSALEDAEGARDCSAHNTPSPLGELEGSARAGPLSRLLRRHAVSPPVQDVRHRCEWVSGASFMVRRQVVEQIGLLDEGFFLYFEEVDYCVRARRAGWEVWYVPESRVVHFEGSSTGIREHARRRPPYWYASRRRFFAKHYGIAGLVVADALWALGHASLRARRLLGLGAGGGTQDPPGMAGDLLWGDLRALARGKVLAPADDALSPG